MSYDTRGRPSTITDGLGTRTLSYGTGSHLLADSLTGVTRTYTDGRLTGLNLGADYGVTYGYDTYGRFGSINAQVAGTGTQTYTYGYLPNSDLLESLTSNHGLTITRSYEPQRDVLTQVQNQFGTNTISQYDYTNDELAQRTSMTTSGTAFDPANPPTISPSTATYTTNNLNQYTSIQYPASSIQLTYDLDGNLIEDNIHHFTYDAENRLTSVTPITPTAGSTKVEYAYDYMSRRVEKQVYTYDGSSWVLETEKSFVYDGWNLVREQTTTGGTTTTDYYVWGLDLSGSLQGAGGIGGLLSKTNSLTSQTYLYTFDANGNVGQLVDSSNGTIAAHYEYTPFGKLLVATGSEADNNVFRFSTKYYDVETELYYYGFRYYEPELGRWLNRDPIEEDGGLNLYGFVGNNNVNFFDILGLACGTHLTRKEAEQLACALNGWLNDVRGWVNLGAGHVIGQVSKYDDIEIVLQFLARYMSKEGGRVVIPYSKLKDDPKLIKQNTRAEQIFHSGNITAYRKVNFVWSKWSLQHSIGATILRYWKNLDGTISGAINEPYSFLDKPAKGLKVSFPLLKPYSELCCWKCGNEVEDIWMGDLETYGLAKSFHVQAEWRLGQNGWKDWLDGN